MFNWFATVQVLYSHVKAELKYAVTWSKGLHYESWYKSNGFGQN